jgi:hypothetical protein
MRLLMATVTNTLVGLVVQAGAAEAAVPGVTVTVSCRSNPEKVKIRNDRSCGAADERSFGKVRARAVSAGRSGRARSHAMPGRDQFAGGRELTQRSSSSPARLAWSANGLASSGGRPDLR